ncbi:glycosyltransferase family 2 protein [Candidatus Bathyarchaeota archaeon]|nr:glycosyltransferase family 2 protein [Candidatus Bathyarchaeota archaeon]
MIPVTVLVCAHNEEAYIGDCLDSVTAQTQIPALVIVVADRCTDRTEEIARQKLSSVPSLILEKDRSSWQNNISENLQMGLEKAKGVALVVVDADMVIPQRFLEALLSGLDSLAAVSALVRTDPSRGLLNRLVAAWELTYRFTPLGEQPRGGARAIATKPLRLVGGFRDVYAWESDLDTRLRKAGFKVKLDRNVSVLHRRKMTVARSVAYQIQAGRARKELHVSLLRTLLHSIVRLRPFVVVGYLSG